MLQDQPKRYFYGYGSSQDLSYFLRSQKEEQPMNPERGKALTRIAGEFAMAMLAYRGAELILSGVGSTLTSSTLPRLAEQGNTIGRLAGMLSTSIQTLSQNLDELEGLIPGAGGAAEWERAGGSDLVKRFLVARTARWARKLPVSLPAMYLTNRIMVAPPGQRLGDRLRSGEMKWYNPVDWFTDFSTVSSRMLIYSALGQVGFPAFGKYMEHVARQHPYFSDFWGGFLTGTSDQLNRGLMRMGAARAGFADMSETLGPISPARVGYAFKGQGVKKGEILDAYQRGRDSYLEARTLSTPSMGGPIPGSRIEEALAGIKGATTGFRQGTVSWEVANHFWKQKFIEEMVAQGIPEDTARWLASQAYVRQPFSRVKDPKFGYAFNVGRKDYALHERFTNFAQKEFTSQDELTGFIDDIVHKTEQSWVGGKAWTPKAGEMVPRPGATVLNAAIKTDQFMNARRGFYMKGMTPAVESKLKDTAYAKAVSYAGKQTELLEEPSSRQIMERLAKYFGVDATNEKALLDFVRQGGWDMQGATNFLQNKGVIATSERQLFNIFGFRPMTAKEFFMRGYATRPELYDELTKLPDADRVLAGARGMWLNRAGEPINFGGLFGLARTAGTFVKQNMRIPILGFNPTGILGEPTRFKSRQMPWMEIHSSGTYQPLAGGYVNQPFVSYKVSPLYRKIFSLFGGAEHPWKFRTYQLSAQSALGMQLRWMTGRQGYTSGVEPGRTRSLLGIAPSEEQPKSIISRYLRWANRDAPLADKAPGRGPFNWMFQKLSRKEPSQNYVDNIISKAAAPAPSTEEVRDAFSTLRKVSRGGYATRRVIDRIDALNKIVPVPNEVAAQEVLKSIIADAGRAYDLPVSQRQLLFRLLGHQAELMRNPNWAFNPARGASIFGKMRLTQLDVVRQDIQAWFLGQSVSGPGGLNAAWEQLVGAAKQGLISRGELRQAQGLLIATRVSMAEGLLAETGPDSFAKASTALKTMVQQWGGEGRTGPLWKFIRHGPEGRIPRWTPPAGSMTYAPIGAREDILFMPTVGDVWRWNKSKALKGILGFGGRKDLQSLSTGAIPMTHIVTRLDRYREFFGVGLDWNRLNTPMGMFAGGWIARTMLPLTLGVGALMATHDIIQERTGSSPLRGLARVGWIEPQKDIARVLSHTPVQPWLQRRAELMGFTHLPFSRTPEEVQQYYDEGDVAIRRGRFWPLGNTPFRGQRIEYFAPNWYRRLEARPQRNAMLYGSTPERLWNNWGPGKVLDPYHWEKKWYNERPYPVTGEMFTGPWGPAQSFLNMTVGSMLKPRMMMHSQEIAREMIRGPVGVPQPPGLQPSIAQIYQRGRVNITNPVTLGRMMGWDNSGFGTYPGIASSGSMGGMDQLTFYNTFYRTVGEMPLALTTRPNGTPITTGTRGKGSGTRGGGMAGAGYAMAGAIAHGGGTAPGTGMAAAAAGGGQLGIPYPGYPVLANQRMAPMQGRLLFPSQAQMPGFGYTVGEFGYHMQEIAGIYGFSFGAIRTMFGGEQDFSPRNPVFQAASRMYGSERSFWDLSLGGLGDINSVGEGQYSNLEISELIRRFIPHRRRQIMEYNPIPNLLGQRYPWLPAENYFMNFHTGDPYIKLTRGEYRLPGPANLALYGSHPDAYGSPYGLEDMTRVLGDVAPWSDEYRMALELGRRSDLPPDARKRLAKVAKQVAAKKKLYEFHEYRFANQDYTTERVTVTGVVEGNPNLFTTREYPGHPLRLAGVRFPLGNPDVSELMADIIKPGTSLTIRRDQSRRVPELPNREQTIDVVAWRGGRNVNQWALERGIGSPAMSEGPADMLVKYSAGERAFGAAWERFAHMDTPFHTKFLPMRSAIEEYERRHLYGRPFQEWQHPIRSFVAPHFYKNIGTRGPILGMVAGGLLGRAFGANTEAKQLLGGIGAGLGLAAGSYGTFYKATHGGMRWIPKEKRQEMAVDEYTDMLEYIKWSRLYHSYRIQSIRRENFDPLVWLEQQRQESSRFLADERFEWQQADVGTKPSKSPAQRSFEGLGPMATMAIMSYKRAKQTAYGVDLYGDWMGQYMAFPKRRRPFFNEFAEAPKKEHKRILSGLPRLERRIMEAKWGLPIEPKPDLIDYFSKHELPPPNWVGWLPEVDMEQVKLKVVGQQGLDYHDMGYYPQEIEEAEQFNYPYPNFSQGSSRRDAKLKLEELFMAAGMRNFQINERISLQPGYQVRLNI